MGNINERLNAARIESAHVIKSCNQAMGDSFKELVDPKSDISASKYGIIFCLTVVPLITLPLGVKAALHGFLSKPTRHA